MATKKKAAPKKAAKKVVKKAAPKKVVKKPVVKKAPVKIAVAKKAAPKNDQQISAKEADKVVVDILKGKIYESLGAAKVIIGEMGVGFFTLQEMVKKSREGKMAIYKNVAHPGLAQKMSWKDAENAIINIFNFGLIERHPEKKECFKIRLDKGFRINYFNQQKELLVTKMSDANIAISVITSEEETKAPLAAMEVVK